MQASERIEWVDHARAAGILLVVLGHTAGLPAVGMQLIYSFHMPLFFFLSGYLLKERHLQLPLGGYVKRLARGLLAPYASFWLLSFLYWLATRSLVLDPSKYDGVSIASLLLGFLHGTGDLGHTLYIINVDLWFLTCLFCTALLYYLLWRWLKGQVLWVCLAAFGGFAPLLPGLLGSRLPWSLELAGVALVFYASGRLLQAEPLPSKRTCAWAIAPLLVAWGSLAWLNGRVDMNTMQFGRLWMFYLTAGLGILLTAAVCRFVPANRVSTWLSENTLVIFPLHQLMFSVFNGISVRLLGLPVESKTTLAASLLYTLLAVACSIPAAWVIRRFAPFMIGERFRAP